MPLPPHGIQRPLPLHREHITTLSTLRSHFFAIRYLSAKGSSSLPNFLRSSTSDEIFLAIASLASTASRSTCFGRTRPHPVNNTTQNRKTTQTSRHIAATTVPDFVDVRTSVICHHLSFSHSSKLSLPFATILPKTEGCVHTKTFFFLRFYFAIILQILPVLFASRLDRLVHAVKSTVIPPFISPASTRQSTSLAPAPVKTLRTYPRANSALLGRWSFRRPCRICHG